MPRYSLSRSPWKTTMSPGASSVPASSEPSITVSAPAAIALATSPEVLMPPSAITGTPCFAATCAQSKIAVTCGTPDAGHDARRADRAGPDADLDRVGARRRSAPRRPRPSRRCRRSARRRSLAFSCRAISMTPARVAVRGVEHEHVDLGGDERRRALAARPARRRPRRRRAAGRARPSSRAGTRSASGCP